MNWLENKYKNFLYFMNDLGICSIPMKYTRVMKPMKRNKIMNTRITYLRDVKGQPVGCLAIGPITPNGKLGHQVSYNLSVLNPSDKFDRKIAREIATGRLGKNPECHTVPVPENADMHMITRSVMVDIIDSKSMPTRAIKAAKLWVADHPGLVMIK